LSAFDGNSSDALLGSFGDTVDNGEGRIAGAGRGGRRRGGGRFGQRDIRGDSFRGAGFGDDFDVRESVAAIDVLEGGDIG
jgi:hypothetical protein